MRLRRGLRFTALALLVVVAAACNSMTVDQSGVYTSSATQQITGTIKVGQGDSLVSLKVNGIDATIDGETYSVDVPLDGGMGFTFDQPAIDDLDATVVKNPLNCPRA